LSESDPADRPTRSRSGGARALLRRVLLATAKLLGLFILFIGGIWFGANTSPGRSLIEVVTARVTGGAVRIEGLSGDLPASIRLSRLTVADASGPWLTIEDAALDWSPGRLLAGEAAVDRLAIGRVALARLPKASGASGGSGLPPLRLVLRRLDLARVEIDPAVAGHPVTLTAEGSGEVTGPDSGSAHLVVATLPTSQGTIPDRYTIDAALDPARLHAALAVAEGADGLLAGFAGLPDLGPLTIDATVDGPMRDLVAKATAVSGPAHANAEGTIDIVGRRANLTFAATAPAMRPGPGVAWSSVRLAGRVNGPWNSPDARGTLTIADLTAAGAGASAVRADLSGTLGGPLDLHATVEDPSIPGPDPALLANGPLVLDATARLDAPDPNVRFTLRHSLASVTGEGNLDSMRMSATVPDLAPFAVLAGVDLAGRADLNALISRSNDTLAVTVGGTIGITGGMAPIPALLGGASTIDLAASRHGEAIDLTRLSIHGQAFDAVAHGRIAGGQVALDWTSSVASLTAIERSLAGTAGGSGHLTLTPDTLSLTSDLTADLAAAGYQSGHVSAHLTADGPPDAPAVRLTATGTALNAPLTLSAAAEPRGGGYHITIDHGTWKSLTASGVLDLAAGAVVPTGDVRLSMGQIGDVSPFLGRPLAGSFDASLATQGASTRISASLKRLAVPGVASAASVALNATVSNPLDHAEIDGTLTADGVAAAMVRGSGRLTATGPLDALTLRLSTDFADVAGAPAQLQASGTLNADERTMALTAMSGNWQRQAIRLLAPAKFALTGRAGGVAGGVSVDRLRLGLRDAELEVAGRVGDALDLRVKLTNLPVDLAALIAPDYAADGTIAGEATLNGPLDRPNGSVRVQASGIRLRAGSARGLPAIDGTMTAALAGGDARLNATVNARGSSLTLTGAVPLRKNGVMNLRAAGTVDLAMFGPILAAQGRSAKGRVALDLGLAGSLTAPRAAGTARLFGGDFSDFSLGTHVSDVAATVQMDGSMVRLTQLTARAGSGTISADGSVDLSNARQVAMDLRVHNARLLASDLATATGDAELTLRGVLDGRLTVGGNVTIQRADITVPERLPSSIVVLKVRIAGKPYVPPPPPPPPPDIALNLTLDAPAQIYIRGRGVDAELGGRIEFTGTATNPVAAGGLHLRRGTVSLAGVSLALTEGTIDFTGHSLTDPALNLVATSTSATTTSTLTIAGAVRDPKLTLSSSPQLPQDEILAQMLFGTGKAQLSPFQVAQIAAALASMSGVGSIGDPLDSLRSKLGLDQLSIGGGGATGGSGATGGPTLQAGRYVMPGVRLGAQQSATGGSTQGTVEVDLAKGLKLETTAGRGNSTATAGGDAASIGLKYQLEY
jgi:translocation and assembly module TamB